jgi:cytochrome c553
MPFEIGATRCGPAGRLDALHSGPMPHRPLNQLVLFISVVAILSIPASADEVSSDGAAPSDGARAWQRCAVCHGADGAGSSDGTFPKIGGQYASVIAAQLAAIRSGERSNPVMKPHVEELSDERDVADVAAYVAGMPRDSTCHSGPGTDLAQGEALYDAACASCHGATGQGASASKVPWLACQHYDYLLRRARQLASWGPSAHPNIEPPLDGLTDVQLRAVMDYASRFAAKPIRSAKPTNHATEAARAVDPDHTNRP